MMNEQDLKFFKMATASALGILILFLITSIIIAFYAADTTPAYQPTTTTYTTAPAQTQWLPLDNTRYKQEEQPQYMTENLNVPPCVEPCKIRVEYGNKYFLPYPTHRYSDRYYYEDYPVYPHYRYSHYPNNQRFFHHRIIQSDYTY
jgi:hypothetical protein